MAVVGGVSLKGVVALTGKLCDLQANRPPLEYAKDRRLLFYYAVFRLLCTAVPALLSEMALSAFAWACKSAHPWGVEVRCAAAAPRCPCPDGVCSYLLHAHSPVGRSLAHSETFQIISRSCGCNGPLCLCEAVYLPAGSGVQEMEL